MLNSQWFKSQIYYLTVYEHHHVLEKAVNNLERLRCRHPGLVLGESDQPLENRIDLIPSEKLLYKFFCIPLKLGNQSAKMDSLGRPCLICFVASARMWSNSTIIFSTISVKAGVRGTLV